MMAGQASLEKPVRADFLCGSSFCARGLAWSELAYIRRGIYFGWRPGYSSVWWSSCLSFSLICSCATKSLWSTALHHQLESTTSTSARSTLLRPHPSRSASIVRDAARGEGNKLVGELGKGVSERERNAIVRPSPLSSLFMQTRARAAGSVYHARPGIVWESSSCPGSLLRSQLSLQFGSSRPGKDHAEIQVSNKMWEDPKKNDACVFGPSGRPHA